MQTSLQPKGEKIMPETKIDRIVNVSGLLCPQPSLVTRKVLESMHKGQVLKVVSDDRRTLSGISTVCRQGNHVLRQVLEEHGQIIYLIEK